MKFSKAIKTQQTASAKAEWQASKLIDMNVYNGQNEKIGDIKGPSGKLGPHLFHSFILNARPSVAHSMRLPDYVPAWGHDARAL